MLLSHRRAVQGENHEVRSAQHVDVGVGRTGGCAVRRNAFLYDFAATACARTTFRKYRCQYRRIRSCVCRVGRLWPVRPIHRQRVSLVGADRDPHKDAPHPLGRSHAHTAGRSERQARRASDLSGSSHHLWHRNILRQLRQFRGATHLVEPRHRCGGFYFHCGRPVGFVLDSEGTARLRAGPVRFRERRYSAYDLRPSFAARGIRAGAVHFEHTPSFLGWRLSFISL